MGETFVIFNPAAGRGRGARRIPRFRELLDRYVPGWEGTETRAAGDERAIADDALARGFRTIVAVGGDGTWSLVADRVARWRGERPRLALLPGGTGNDFGKTSGITWERAEDVVRAMAAGRTRRIDVGRVGERHFLNVVGMGFDIAVIDDSRRVPVLKGDALYKFCAARQLFFFRGLPITVATGNGAAPESARHLMLVVANGRYFGGSFDIAPDADLGDGELHVVSILDASPLGRARLFGLVARGAHGGDRRVRVRRGAAFTISFTGPLRYEVDGEVLETPEDRLRIETVPGALELVVP
jgi:YegS/Rv2252/BmrU family lipid kinase